MTRLGVPGKVNARQHTPLAALNEISRKLDRLKLLQGGGGGTPITGFSTATNQTNQITQATLTNTLLESNDAAIVRLTDIESGVIPTFPFNITQIGFQNIDGSETASVSATVNNITELVALWNANITGIRAETVTVVGTSLATNYFKLVPITSRLPAFSNESILLSQLFVNNRVIRGSNLTPLINDFSNQSSNDLIVEQLRRSYQFEVYRNWEFIKNNRKEFTYYAASAPGSDPNNPSGTAGNIATVRFTIGTNLTQLTQTFAYNTDDNIISITVL